MSEISGNNRSANASDVGLIVQGSLIFLSAIVAILGYSVQAHFKKKERRHEMEEKHRDYLRKAQLDTLRNKLRVFVGPATQLALSAWNCIWRNCLTPKALVTWVLGWGRGTYCESQPLAGGDRIYKYWTNSAQEGGMGFSFFQG